MRVTLPDMTPLSEADPDIRSKVEGIVGPCLCSWEYRKKWAGHSTDVRDPKCKYHAIGESVASLLRDNRRLRNSLNLLKERLRKDK